MAKKQEWFFHNFRTKELNYMWRFIDLDKIDGFYSAALFESIARNVGSNLSPETILFWRVKSPVVYLGYHQCVEDEINEEYCKDNNIGIIRRILGGGCGFCDEDQILYSIIGKDGGIIPADIQEAYKKVLGGVVNALAQLGEEAKIEPARNAVYTSGRKISGNAQGRHDSAVLINGSLLLDFNFGLMDKVLKNPTKNLYPVKSAREGMVSLKDLGVLDIDLVKKTLREGFESALGIKSGYGNLTTDEIQIADNLLAKYKDQGWTYKMDIKRAIRKRSSSLLPQ
ncbi:MAG: biotin/lipoate A/B protein ligase family protein [Candidatus Methanoperedens sp.]|nr:biotin/lipoate A/B protein ligase family protein [Candidatus Methanoperedens sp.]